MDKNVLVAIGLVDNVLDILQVSDNEYLQTRKLLFANISIKFATRVLKIPRIEREFVRLSVELKPNMTFEEIRSVFSKSFIGTDINDLEIGKILIEDTKKVLNEFVDKVSPNNQSMINMLKTI